MTQLLHAREIDGAGPNDRPLADVAVTPDGRRYAACFAQTLVIGTWLQGTAVATINMPASAEAVAFAPDGARVACACADGAVRVHDVPGGNETGVLRSDIGGYYEVAWSPDSTRIAAGHYEQLVSVFDPTGGSSTATLDPDLFSDEARTAVAFSPDGALLASTAGNALMLWSLPAKKRRKIALRGDASVIDAAFAPDGEALAAIAETEGRMTLHLWTGDGARKRGRLALPGFSQRLAWSFDSALIAVVERDEPGLSLWDAAALKRSDIEVAGVPMAMSALAAHPRRLAFIAGSEHGRLVIYEAGEGSAP